MPKIGEFFTYFIKVLPISARGLRKISMRANVPDERVEELIVPVLINQNLNESCIFLNENHACLSYKSYDISERLFQRFVTKFFTRI